MNKKLIIDNRIRNIEKGYLESLGYNIIQLEKQGAMYEEISSHVDVFFAKINNKIIVEPNLYDMFKNYTENITKGKTILKDKYPFDIAYNVCTIGKNVIHNFKYTDTKVLEIIKKEKLNMININQGYSKCSIAMVDDNSAICSDKKICEKLIGNGIDVLFLDIKNNIKLIKNGKYSNMSGFIGGATARLNDEFIIFGDKKHINRDGKLENFISKKGLKLTDFKGLDVIDYGGVLEIS